MGTISLEQKDNLYWLGRYTERVYTTLKRYFVSFDMMIDMEKVDYRVFCESIDIPDVYGSKEVFLEKYPFDPENPDSIYSNLIRAYDDAIVLREDIGSEALSYIQLAIYEFQAAARSDAPLIQLQKVIDYISAFWGNTDDAIENEQIRNLIKLGKRVERMDLYSRLEMPVKDMVKEARRLSHRIVTSGMKYRENALAEINRLVTAEIIDYSGVVRAIESLAV